MVKTLRRANTRQTACALGLDPGTQAFVHECMTLLFALYIKKHPDTSFQLVDAEFLVNFSSWDQAIGMVRDAVVDIWVDTFRGPV